MSHTTFVSPLPFGCVSAEAPSGGSTTDVRRRVAIAFRLRKRGGRPYGVHATHGGVVAIAFRLRKRGGAVDFSGAQVILIDVAIAFRLRKRGGAIFKTVLEGYPDVAIAFRLRKRGGDLWDYLRNKRDIQSPLPFGCVSAEAKP